MFTSQPSLGSLLQSAKPAVQLSAHTPPLHTAVEFAPIGQGTQPPQVAAEDSVSASQPSAGTTLQSAKPGSQLMIAQAPTTQSELAWARLQASSHMLQSLFVPSVVSQPSLASLLQSAWGGSQIRTQAPFWQVSAGAQTLPHTPQFAGSTVGLASQPSATTMLQSTKGMSHMPTVHTPPTQPAVAPGTTQSAPHIPQLAGSTAVCTSQPLGTSPSQSAKPGSHWPMPQAPLSQTGVALGMSQGSQVGAAQPKGG